MVGRKQKRESSGRVGDILRGKSSSEILENLKEIYDTPPIKNGVIPPEISSSILDILYEENSPEILCWAAAILGRHYELMEDNILAAATYILIRNLDRPHPYVRATSLIALGNILYDRSPVMLVPYAGRIMSMLRDDCVMVRTFALDTLSGIIDRLPEDAVNYVIPEIIRSLNNGSNAVKLSSLYLIWKILNHYPHLAELFLPKILTVFYSSSEELKIMAGWIMVNYLSGR